MDSLLGRAVFLAVALGTWGCGHWPSPGASTPDSEKESRSTGGAVVLRGETGAVSEPAVSLQEGIEPTRSQHLEPSECRQWLESQSQRVSAPTEFDDAAVRDPIWLASAPAGVAFRQRSDSEVHEIVDCRLAVALAQWADLLAEAGVTEVIHLSAYRAGARVRGSGRASGHASALAMDVYAFRLENGRELRVEESWTDRRRGLDPCGSEFEVESEAGDQAMLRGFVCSAVEAGLFQVVLTPHHDEAHRNHIHVEVRPDVDWHYIH